MSTTENMRTKRRWPGKAAAAAMAIGFTLAASAAVAAPAVEQVDSVIAPSAQSLLKFYPSVLALSPIGAVEDQAVWLAKVQGLMASAPSWLQQNLPAAQRWEENTSD